MIGKKISPIPFTKSGLETLRTESSRLAVTRQEILVRLQTAREMGDLSENGAYKAARFELGALDRRVREINHFLRFGYVPDKKRGLTVAFGSQVVIKNSTAKEFSYLIVSKYESDPNKGRLSTESPLGRALIGHRVGDEVSFSSASGPQTFTITKLD